MCQYSIQHSTRCAAHLVLALRDLLEDALVLPIRVLHILAGGGPHGAGRFIGWVAGAGDVERGCAGAALDAKVAEAGRHVSLERDQRKVVVDRRCAVRPLHACVTDCQLGTHGLGNCFY